MVIDHDSVSILGATGDLGFGLAVRWAGAGVPIVIGSRDGGRAEEAAERVRAAVPDAPVEGLDNAAAAAASPVVVDVGAVRGRGRDLQVDRRETLKGRARS